MIKNTLLLTIMFALGFNKTYAAQHSDNKLELKESLYLLQPQNLESKENFIYKVMNRILRTLIEQSAQKRRTTGGRVNIQCQESGCGLIISHRHKPLHSRSKELENMKIALYKHYIDKHFKCIMSELGETIEEINQEASPYKNN